ncbi:hypothetical protein [Niabella hibiscisoli]|uniref:hypothetical protein n=1 Tax=Niabella hibiscisoli TaxID=1825928 RepID=UPI001F0E5A5D|nr:hypothetical protein [Niabella hibiscisoli]MCH5718243.1 hypothetical protein [Niabella hibiscisoli]
MVASITSIKPSELRMPSSNLTNSLAGRLTGMVAYQRSGEPGQDNAAFLSGVLHPLELPQKRPADPD